MSFLKVGDFYVYKQNSRLFKLKTTQNDDTHECPIAGEIQVALVRGVPASRLREHVAEEIRQLADVEVED